MKEQTQDSINLEIPSRWRRFSAYFLDLIINITIIWLIANIIVIFSAKTTLWNMIVWIQCIGKDGTATLWQISLRYLIFYQTLPLLVYYFCRYYYFATRWFVKCRDCIEAKDKTNMILWCICLVFSVMILINVIEFFFKCPTFIDKRLWIKRIYKKSK